MAGDEDDGLLNLSLPQKLQLGVFGAGTAIFALTYLTGVLLNGFQYTNQWILSNPVPVLAYWSLQIGLIPVYKRTDPRQLKYVKQFAYKFFFTGAPFMIFWAYYQFNPPTTGIDRIISTFSRFITSVSVIGLLASAGNFKMSFEKE